MLAVASIVGLFLGPPVVASLLARWTSSPSSDELRHGFPVVPTNRRPPPLPPPLPGTSDVRQTEQR